MSENDDIIHLIPTRYANDFRIGYNRDEFIVEVGQSFEASEVFFWRIVCTPPHAQAFLVLLQECVAQYGGEYGPIPRPEEP